MDGCHIFQDHPPSSSEEDEVTFLLRLKPAPTPPARRRKNITAPQSNTLPTPKGWDVVIERQERDISSPNSSSLCSSPVRQRRFSFEGQCANRASTQGKGGNRICCRDGSGVNCETGEANLIPVEGNFRGSGNSISVFETSPYVRMMQHEGPDIISNLNNPNSLKTEFKSTDTTKDEEPPPIPPRFKPSAPPQEPDDNYCWWGAKPHNYGGVFLDTNDEKKGVAGFSNYCVLPCGRDFGGPQYNFASSLPYEPNLYNHQDSTNAGIIQTTPVQSISTYSIARPLSASGFYIGPSAGQTQLYSKNDNGVVENDYGNSRNSRGSLGCSGQFPGLSLELVSPTSVVGRPPKPLPRSFLVAEKNSEEAGTYSAERDKRDGIFFRVSENL